MKFTEEDLNILEDVIGYFRMCDFGGDPHGEDLGAKRRVRRVNRMYDRIGEIIDKWAAEDLAAVEDHGD
jgi:hypothetical protein